MKLKTKKFYSVLLTCVLITACQTSNMKTNRDPAEEQTAAEKAEKKAEKKIAKKEMRTYLKNLSVEERTAYLQKARVTNLKYDATKVSSIDVVTDLETACGPEYRYSKTSGTAKKGYFFNKKKYNYDSYSWPTVECNYKPDPQLGGGTAKFQCDFKDDSADGIETHKVKYARDPSEPDHAEVLETTVAPLLARLVGFYSETYCPAQVVCKNCSSQDPWKEKHSAARASQETYNFPLTVVEYPLKAHTMSNKDIHPYVQGIEWYELKMAKGDSDQETKNLLIEREAWMLWLNFIQHTDAGSYNERLSCLEVEMAADGKPVCKKSIMYTHDYGHAFYKKFEFDSWAARDPFKPSQQGQSCIGNMTMEDLGLNPKSHFSGIIFSPAISSEARDLLVQRLELITDTQLEAVFQLGRLEELMAYPTRDLVATFRKKIAQMKSANCLPFDAGKSVLYPTK